MYPQASTKTRVLLRSAAIVFAFALCSTHAAAADDARVGPGPAGALGPQPPADAVPRKPGGFIANGAANCRGAVAANKALLTATVDGLRNTGAAALVLCHQPNDEFARFNGNGTTNTAGITSFHIVFRNFNAGATLVTCTGLAGKAGTTKFSSNKSVSVPGAGGRAGLDWVAATDNANVPFQRPSVISCTLPTNVEINESYNRYFREVGDFNPP